MRLFIAIDFNELKDYFVELQSFLPKNARLSFTKTFHLTLKFLGDVQPNTAGIIIDILKNIKFGTFSVFLDDIGIFPSENYIRVVWVGLKPEDKKEFVERIKKIKVEQKKLEIKNFKLIKSTLTPKGPIYEDLVLFNPS